MAAPKNFKPRFQRTTGSFQPRKFDPVRDADQRLHKTEEWKQFSLRYLKDNTECYVCGEKSQVTDHIEPSRGRKEVFERDGNFLPLCISCHNSVTAKFDMRYREAVGSAEKIKWMNIERAKNQVLKDKTFLKPKFVKYKSK